MDDNAGAHRPSQNQSRSDGFFFDPTSQIKNPGPDLSRKRRLSEFETNSRHAQYLLLRRQDQQRQLQQQALLDGVFLRSVKPRTNQQAPQAPPVSSPEDLSSPAALSPGASSVSPSPAPLPSRIGLQLPPRPIPKAAAYGGVPGAAANVSVSDQEKAVTNRLRELEKQMLEDEDDQAEEAVSAVTNSEWSSDTIQTLIQAPQNPNLANANQSSAVLSPSSSGSSLSSSAATPQSCPKQLLVDAAASISDGDSERALEILSRMPADPSGRPDLLVASHVLAALRRRVCGPREGFREFGARERAAAMRVLYCVSPCFSLAVWAANQAILDATSDMPENINVVDLGGGSGQVQFQNLAHQLAARGGGRRVTLRIITVEDPEGGARELLRKLTPPDGVVVVEHGGTGQRASDLSRASLGCGPDDVIVVNLAHALCRVPDESVRTDNPRDALLRSLKALQPRVVTMVEEDMNGNTAPLATRVAEACAHYGALLESLEGVLPGGPPSRARLAAVLGRRIGNMVACEGERRVERCERFGKWRARLRMAGFRQLPPRGAAVTELQTRGDLRLTVKEEIGGVCFGWMGRMLTVSSAWH